MKKFILFLLSILYYTTPIQSQNINYDGTEFNKENISDIKLDLISYIVDNNKSNKDISCVNMNKFKVIQVFDDGRALATECNTDLCLGTIVLLVPQRNISFYDDMIVSAPMDKCFIQDGIYRYISKNGSNKTVPILKYHYKYDPKSDKEILERLNEFTEEMRFNCKLYITIDEKDTKENLSKCDCFADSWFSILSYLKEADKYNEKDFLFILQRKCGDFSNI